VSALARYLSELDGNDRMGLFITSLMVVAALCYRVC